MTNSPEPVPSSASRPGILRHWPALAAGGASALIAFDMAEGVDLAPAPTASALVCFGAAALRRASTAWPLFFAACVVVFATEALGGGDVDPTWVLLTLAAPLLASSLRPARSTRPRTRWPAGCSATRSGTPVTTGSTRWWSARSRSSASSCDTLLATLVMAVTVNG
ncbi:hypothetical protein [Streptomyces sp. NPDC050121]|uniref:hypothetical protein n=1 Tax=Streptomyces sp. NPDC050121 TaxID=3365601 RepID=UPI003791D973